MITSTLLASLQARRWVRIFLTISDRSEPSLPACAAFIEPACDHRQGSCQTKLLIILISTDHTKLPRYQCATVDKTQCWRSLTGCRSHNIISDSLRPATLGILRRSRYDAYVDQVLQEKPGRVSDISNQNNCQMLRLPCDGRAKELHIKA